MKTILYFITQNEFGGAQKYIFELTKGLKANYQIGVVYGGKDTDSEFKQKLTELGVSIYCITSLKRSISPINDLVSIFKIIKVIKASNPDVIHLNSSKISILGSIAGYLARSKQSPFKIIYTVHGWVFNEPMAKWKATFYKRAEKFTAKFKDIIICINAYDLAIARDVLNIPENKLRLIPNGLNLKNINFTPRAEAQKELIDLTKGILKITDNTILIGSIGNLYPTKGYEYFIEAFKIIKTSLQVQIDNKIKVKAIIIGEGFERLRLEKILSQENLTDDIFLIGALPNASRLLKAFDIYICSSVKEGLPYSILEAGLAELPIIATNVGGIPDIINNHINGLLVESQNPTLLTQAIKELIANPQLRRELSAKVSVTINQNFKIERAIALTQENY